MVALITGGGRGIGRVVALRLAHEGHSVAIAARSADQLAETVALSDGKIFAVTADIASKESVRAMVRQVEEKLGPVELLVNNAAIAGPLEPFWESDPDEWWHCLEVNLRGTMLCCREVVPGMMARRAGRIVNLSSGAGSRAVLGMSSYGLSKTAVMRFSEQLALELKPHGVSVFAIRPGIVRTAMVEDVRKRIPIVQKYLDDGLDNQPEETADLISTLASGRADALSGRLLSVREDIPAMVRRAEEIAANDLYLLRVRELPS